MYVHVLYVLRLTNACLCPCTCVCVCAMVGSAVRRGHPSGQLFAWGGRTIVDSHRKKLQPPTVEEGFARVVVVRTQQEVR